MITTYRPDIHVCSCTWCRPANLSSDNLLDIRTECARLCRGDDLPRVVYTLAESIQAEFIDRNDAGWGSPDWDTIADCSSLIVEDLWEQLVMRVAYHNHIVSPDEDAMLWLGINADGTGHEAWRPLP